MDENVNSIEFYIFKIKLKKNIEKKSFWIEWTHVLNTLMCDEKIEAEFIEFLHVSAKYVGVSCTFVLRI